MMQDNEIYKIEIYKTEIVPITFTITDRLNEEVYPTSVVARIYSETDTLLDLRNCSVDSNTLTMVTSGTPFDTVGHYKVAFEIFHTPYKSFYVTRIKVKDF